jgi:hypothetical protein
MNAAERWVDVAGTPMRLVGRRPREGEALDRELRFSIPAARNTEVPLADAALREGAIVVSTLPNIGRHACLAQIVLLHEHLPSARVVHVSADAPAHWREVDAYHPDVSAPGYSLHGADPASRDAFCRAFGVGVEGKARIAHGLFALRDGVFTAVEIPTIQVGTPDVPGFLSRLRDSVRSDP